MDTRIKKFIFILLILVISISLRVKDEQSSQSFYFFLAIDRTSTKSGKAYMSKLIHYPGYTECNKLSDVYFQLQAKDAFNDFMRSNYNSEFSSPYGISEKIKVINTKYMRFDRLKTLLLAEERLKYWEENEQQGNFKKADFSYNCT